MRIRLVDKARREFDLALDFYLRRSPSAAAAFIDAFESAKIQIAAFPSSGAAVPPGARRILLGQFPYKLVYRIEGDEIVVYAVAHQRRKPGYWRRRVPR